MIEERVAVFIDGPNIYGTCRALDMRIDYKRLLDFFESEYDYLLRAFYYTPVLGNNEVDKKRSILDFISYNGYSLVTRESKEIVRADDSRVFRGSTDMDLVVGIMKMVNTGKVDHIVLMSGNGDFIPVIEYVKDMGILVTVISSDSSRTGGRNSVSNELKRVCDEFIELDDIRHEVGSSNDLEEVKVA